MIDLNTFYIAVVTAFLIGALVAWLFARVNGRRRDERYEAQIGALQGRLARREQELTEAQARANALDGELANETLDNQTLRHELSTNRDELTAARDALVAVRHELEATTKEQEALHQAVSLRQSEIDQLNTELADAQEQLGLLRTQVDDLAGRNVVLERTLEDTRGALDAVLDASDAPADHADAVLEATLEPSTIGGAGGQEALRASEQAQDGDATRMGELSLDAADMVAVGEGGLRADDAVTRELGMGLADAKAEMDGLRRSLSVLTSVSAEMASTLSQRNQQYERILAGIQAASGSRTKAASELDDGTQPAQGTVLPPVNDVTDDESALAAVDVMRASATELQRHAQELVTTRNALRAQLADREASLGELRVQLNALNDELAEHSAGRADLQATLAAREDELEQLRHNWTQLEARLLDVEAARAAAESAVADRESLLAERAQVLADLQARMEEVDAARAALDSMLQARDATLVDVQERLGARSDEVQHLRVLVSQKDDDLAAHTTRLDELVTQVTGLQSDLYATSAGKAEVEGALAERMASLAMLRDQIGALQAELDLAGVAKADLDAQLAQRDAALEDLQAQLRELDEVRNGAESIATRAQEELAGARAAFDARQADLTLQLEALHGQKAALADQVESLAQEVQEAQRKLDATRTELQDRQEELAALQEQKSAVQAELDQAQAEVDRIGKESAAQLAAFTAAAVTTTKRIDSLEQEREALMAEIEQLSTRLDATLADKQAVDAALHERQAQLDETTAQLAAATEQLAHAAQERDLAAQRAADIELELSQARSRIEAAASLFDAMPGARAQSLDVVPLPAAKQAAAAGAIASGTRPVWIQVPQKLTEVNGIGSVYEQRLQGESIGTYWELVSLPDEEYVRILQLSGLRRKSTDLDAIRREALRLAQETDSIGHLWDGSVVDDFEPIPGIGKTFERRLYQAGILTYEDLANLDPDRLAEIVQAPKLSTPDYRAWLAKAREFIRARQTEHDGVPSEDSEPDWQVGLH